MTGRPLSPSATWVSFALTIAALAMGVIPPASEATRLRAVWNSAHTPERERSDRENRNGGYYEGLIGVDEPGQDSSRLASGSSGKPAGEPRFTDANISRRLPGDFLMFELLPNVNRTFYGLPFTTNIHGMRDRPCQRERSPDTFRIVVLGSSIDMGWGVGTEETYINLLEDWLNARAQRLGLPRRFEVLNFAVAAYSPLQRLETFRRKAAEFDPDLVLYSATTLDIRLLEIHLCDMLQNRVDLTYDFLREEIQKAGFRERDLRLNSQNRLCEKNAIKAKLRPRYWPIYEKSLETLARECRSLGIPLASMIIPRAGECSSQQRRASVVTQLHSLLSRHCDIVLDLSDSFDGISPSKLEISSSDDHPNALGHDRLAKSLARALTAESRLRALVLEEVIPEHSDGPGHWAAMRRRAVHASQAVNSSMASQEGCDPTPADPMAQVLTP